MRVLVAHNRYRSSGPSGENAVVDAEVALLREAGAEVHVLSPRSDDIVTTRDKVRAALHTVYDAQGVAWLDEVSKERPYDVVHVHNLFPELGPAFIAAAHRSGARVVHTVHNYRLSCLNGTHLRDGEACDLCTGRRLKGSAVIHGCYRGSRTQSIPMAASRAVNQRAWLERIHVYLALTPFMRQRLALEGVPAGRITVRPTWCQDAGRPDLERPRPPRLLYAGRLDQVKGIRLLLDAWGAGLAGDNDDARPTLEIAGDGPLHAVVSAAAEMHDTIEFRGTLSPEELRAHMDDACALVVPSLWFEGFPLVAVEALSRGLPIITLEGVAFASTVGTDSGWVCAPDPRALRRTMEQALRESDVGLRTAARLRYDEDHSPASALSSLLAAYGVPAP